MCEASLPGHRAETWPAGQPDWARQLVWNAAIPASVVNQRGTAEIKRAGTGDSRG